MILEIQETGKQERIGVCCGLGTVKKKYQSGDWKSIFIGEGVSG